ncbi:MAG: DUF3459 domain-containing protein [Deltaproteobacteria bacterium]|nr:DUF3459 domain-containing protein [Deltaproteobacteria bacterium]
MRSFADSDGDGVGDLRGLMAHLDVLNDGDPRTDDDLGVDTLWLMPINPSPSYHGYDVTDYRAVAPAYGTLADLDALLGAAHARGMHVVLDLVVNHTSSAHPWFRAARDPTHAEHARYRDYYRWRAAPSGDKRPWDGAPLWHESGDGRRYYALFWSGMPDLNLENPAVQQEALDVMRFWLARGVDGFRLDAVRHLIEGPDGAVADVEGSHALLRRLRAAIERDHPNALLVGEAWTDTPGIARYAGDGDELHLAFSFDVAAAVLQAINDDQRLPLAQALARAETAFADRAFEAQFLTNHDQARVMRQLGGDVAKATLAAATLFALPGTPFVYYGEEIGMQGGASRDDEDKRTPMRFARAGARHGFTSAARAWHDAPEAAGVDVESQRAAGLWRSYQRLIALRHAERALSSDEAVRPVVTGGGRGAFALLRSRGAERVLFVANFHREPAPPFSVEVGGAPRVLLASGAPKVRRDGDTLVVDGLGARGWAFVRLTR